MRQPVETQLRTYFEQIEETHGPLSTNTILERAAPVQVVPNSRPVTPPRRLVRRWAWAVALIVFAGVAILLGAIGSDAPPIVDQPVTTTIPGKVPPASDQDPVVVGQSSYEAVFLRLEVVDGSPEVLVVGVDPEGVERQIATLPGAWVTYRISVEGFLAPMGAVSTTGLLAVPSGTFEEMHWEIFDLHRPQEEPIVIAGIQQDVEQLQFTPYFATNMRPSVFWGPGERLAIPWYLRGSESLDWRLSFVEGRTGVATSVDVPDDLLVDRFWTIDGSGVFLRGSDNGAPHLVLAPDGTVTDGTAAVAESGCETGYQSGAELEASFGHVVLQNPDGTQEQLPSPAGVGFACLAPDESAIVFTIEIGEGNGPASASSPLAGLITPGSDSYVEIEGSFAGWLEVDQ